MTKILLIESSANVRDLLSINLNMYVGVDVICRASLAEAIEVLKVVPEMDLIIARDKIEFVNVAHDLYRFLQAHPKDIPMVVMGAEHDLQHTVKTVAADGPTFMKEVIGASAKILGVTAQMMVQKVVPDFYPVEIKYFYHFDKAPCDVYMRINRGDGEYQYVKRIHHEEGIDDVTIDTYKKKGVREFFVESAYRLEFSKSLARSITAVLENAKSRMDERMTALATGQDLVAEDLKTVGLTTEVVSLANMSIHAMTKIVSTMPTLRNLMSELLKSRGSYRYRHAQIITYLSCHVVNRMEWGSKEQADKLCFVAFFHDITLPNDEEAAIHSHAELKAFQASAEVEARVQKHAYEASEMIKAYPSIPLGADTLIKQHHGTKNGVGFPDTPSQGISPLAIVFIVVEEFTNRLLKSKSEHFDVKATLVDMEKIFSMAKYKKVLEIMGPALGL